MSVPLGRIGGRLVRIGGRLMRGCCCEEPPPPPEPCPNFVKTGEGSSSDRYPIGGVAGLFRLDVFLTSGVIDLNVSFANLGFNLGLIGPNQPRQFDFCLPPGVPEVTVTVQEILIAFDRAKWSYSGGCTGQLCVDPIDLNQPPNNPLP